MEWKMMTKALTFILIIFSQNLYCQNKGVIKLRKNICLKWEIQNFQKKEHLLEYCEQSGFKYLWKIDNQEWFGCDLKMEPPKNELTNLELIIEDKKIPLETTKMFNPNSSGKLSGHQIELKGKNGCYNLFAFFSEGAGTYSAHWKIENYESDRIVLSKEEKYFEWQMQ